MSFPPGEQRGALAVPGQGFSPAERHDSRVHARVIYDRIQGELKPPFKGKMLAVEVESGDHFIGETVLEAAAKALARYPDRLFGFFQVDESPAVVKLR